ncbi:arsenosugar biosynthesis radical SAM (seleno)protein ArsS [Dorea amylophila]|uniref:arsenosugar biosynthesis radical SAM (seleno)protein ArsS n=1 Tax=Dorea amylophila TaxID=2981789 RepID=UPI0022E61F69|nr:arsenosugar biosynthesis radical SAM (seleno)protein ArsS [Dorea amylophila]
MDDIIKDFHDLTEIPPFQQMISDKKYMDTEEYLDVLQMNIGRKCNLICKHCHVNAGPVRTEEMSREVMDDCLAFAKEQKIATIDITGGAPEMNPNLEYLIEESSKICNHVIVRTNLVILLDEAYKYLIEVYAKNKVEIVCSLPYYRAAEMDKVRGDGSFDKAIEVLRCLNATGYGKSPELVLNMVYNPAGAFFPPDQEAMEKEYKQRLFTDFGIKFNNLYTLYNNPMGRFGAFLRNSGNLKRYMKKLFDAFNADTVEALMCRTQISVDYDGQLYDCDFNLAAGLTVIGEQKISDVTGKPYQVRKIRMDKHCYACTAGAGSS